MSPASGLLDKRSNLPFFSPLAKDSAGMGRMRFVISPPDRISPPIAGAAYLSGLDRVPWACRVDYHDGALTIERSASDSGNLHLPWPVEGHGLITLSTASLMERDRPYPLPLELARGKVGQLRNQISEWRISGMQVPEAADRRADEAVKHLGRAVAAQADPDASAGHAERAIEAAVEAVDVLLAAYAEQSIAARRRGGQKLVTFLGASLGNSPLDGYTAREFLGAFNVGNVPLCWREIEATEGHHSWEVADRQIQWCRDNGLKVCAGPLLQLDSGGIPDSLYLWEGDFDSLMSLADEYVRAAVDRYRGKVDLWLAAARFNTAEVLSLSDEETLRLTVRAIETLRSVDAQTPVVVSFDQPWAEYLIRRDSDIPPIHLADMLARGNLGLTGLGLEINVGACPRGTLPRDPLELSRQLDFWGGLGMPLVVVLTVPGGNGADPLARRPGALLPGAWTLQAQREWVSRFLPVVLAKPFVHGVMWNQLRDSEPHDFPHAGLFDLRRHPKPALRILTSLRQAHLK